MQLDGICPSIYHLIYGPIFVDFANNKTTSIIAQNN